MGDLVSGGIWADVTPMVGLFKPFLSSLNVGRLPPSAKLLGRHTFGDRVVRHFMISPE